MGWFKADDQLPFHRKTLRAGNAAMGLWIRAGTWLRGQPERDAPGVLTYVEARTMGTAAEIRRLLDAGLWHPCKFDGEKAVRFHEWEHYQPPSEALEGRRTDWALRKRRQRKHRAGDHTLCLLDYCDDATPLEPPDDWPDHA